MERFHALLFKYLKVLLSTSHIFSFCLGISAIPLVRQVKHFYNTIFTTELHGCENYITEIDHIPKNSLIVIGHAYGSPDDNISTTVGRLVDSPVVTLLKENSTNISRIVFTGDVLDSPSVKL